MGACPSGFVVLDVSELPCEMGAVELLARLQLVVRREGRELVLIGTSPALRELIELAGLTDVIHPAPPERAKAPPPGRPPG